MQDEKVIALLHEIRDSHRELLNEYRRVANEALAIQQRAFEIQQSSVTQQRIAVEAQANHLRLYRRVILATALLVAVGVAFLFAYA